MYWLLSGIYQRDDLCHLAQINYLISLMLFSHLLSLYSFWNFHWLDEGFYSCQSQLSLFSFFTSGISMSLNPLAFFRIGRHLPKLQSPPHIILVLVSSIPVHESPLLYQLSSFQEYVEIFYPLMVLFYSFCMGYTIIIFKCAL